jgi:DNA-binding HxlR family transcriptional regulator
MGKRIIGEPMSNQCKGHLLAVHDTLDLLNGKWKIAIISSLSFNDKRRFGELQRDVNGIGAKMLSKELRDLETNGLVKRTVFDTKPVTVEYELTDYGRTLEEIILAMSKWGHQHRQRIIAEMGEKEVALVEMEN